MHYRLLSKTILILAICFGLSACTGTRPAHLGSPLTSLLPCPDSPNCVSSLADNQDETHYIEPLSAKSANVISRLSDLIQKNPAAKIISESDTYLYAEYTSKLLRFVDDVEFLYQAEDNVVHVRSASRLGRSDFGVNRERIETLRQQLQP